MLNILVMGAGAIGCFVGGSLAGVGHRVTLVGRAGLMDAIARQGLSIGWSNQPAKTVFPNTVTTVAAPATPYDFVILTVKTPATAAALEQLAILAAPPGQTWFVSLQNGVGSEEAMAAAFGRAQVIAGTITIPIQSPQPGAIQVSKAKGGLGLAPLEAGHPVARLADALNQAGLPTTLYADYRAVKWSKLLLNIVNNAASAILDWPPAQIIAQPALFDLEIAALREGVAVMKAQGIKAVKLPGYPVQWLARLVSARWLPPALARAMLRPAMQSGRGAKMPSLHIDLAGGRSTSEIEALNGAIVAAGRQHGLPTPVNRALTQIYQGLITGELNRADYRHQPEKLLQAAKNVK